MEEIKQIAESAMKDINSSKEQGDSDSNNNNNNSDLSLNYSCGL